MQPNERHWAAILLALVASTNKIQTTVGEGTSDDYLDYDSDEDDIISSHASNEPSYIREIRKYRKLGIDYDLHPVPVPVYYPVHIPKPYYSKKTTYPYYSDYNKPYKYSKHKPYNEKEENAPSNETESSSSPSKSASRESSSRSRNKYSRPFYFRGKAIDDHHYPIPFKDQDPEFTTPLPLPPPPPKPRKPSISSPSSKRTIANNKEPRERLTHRKVEYTTPRLPVKKSVKISDNSPRVQYRYRERESTSLPPRRHHTQANNEEDRTYESPTTQERSRPYSTNTQSRTAQPRQYQQNSYSQRENLRSRPPPQQKPPMPRYRSETTSKKPHHEQNDELSTKLGFANFKGSFSDLVKYDSPFAKESNGKRKDSFTKPLPLTQSRKEDEKESEEDRDSTVRSPPPTRQSQTKVQYDDDYDDTDGSSHTSQKQPRNKVYKKYEEREPPRHSENRQHSQQENYKPNKYHSSTPSTRSEPYHRHSYSSPAPKNHKRPREHTYREHLPSEERGYRDRASSAPSSDDGDDGSKGKLIPRRYVPSKRHYDVVEDRREPESAEDSSEEETSIEESVPVTRKKNHRNKRHSTKPRSWQRIVNESRITTISSSNPSVLKIFKAVKTGKANEDVILFDTRVTKDKRGQIRQILTKSMPFSLRINQSDVPSCARGNNLDYCVIDLEYPRENIVEALQRNSGQWRSLLNIEPGSDNIQRRFIVQNGTLSSGCKSINSWIVPLRAKDIDGIWRVVANVDEFKQSVSLEICSEQDEVCNAFQNSVCKQQSVERHLVTLNNNNRLSLKRFKFPSYCSCSRVTA